MKKIVLIFLLGVFFLKENLSAQTLYFPPINSSLPWDTLSTASLGWCYDKIDSLYNYLDQENTKGFIVLKDGKIVLEKYFASFTKDSLWYWASAGKTMTSFLVGQAQEDGVLSMNDKSSQYLGSGWTNCSTMQEDSITIRHQLTMSSGLDDGVSDNHCTIDTCLNYLAPVSTRWAYHNAVYTLLEQVLTSATSSNINAYTQQKILTPTGMNGFWYTLGFDNVFFSNVRSMARFGLMIQANGIWDHDTLLHDNLYKVQMRNTSQTMNKSYGYLWWLNGKSSYMVPTSQIIIPGSYAPDAPADMYAGIGKNGQIVSIAPSKGIVMIRMGENPTSSAEVPFLLCTHIWQRLNEVMCGGASINQSVNAEQQFILYPNPANHIVHVKSTSISPFQVSIFDIQGRKIASRSNESSIDVSALQNGIYMIQVNNALTSITQKFIKE